MQQDIVSFVQSCRECQVAEQSLNSKFGPYSVQLPTRQSEKIFIDIYGPLPRSRDGNYCILILCDSFRKFVFMLPLRDTKAGHIMKDECFEWGIKHINSSPHCLCPNIIERVNKNFKTAVRIFHCNHHRSWVMNHPDLSLAFYYVSHSAKGFRPVNRKLTSPLLNVWGIPCQALETFSNSKVQNIWQKECANLEKVRRFVAKKHDRDRLDNIYNVGDLVVCKQVVNPRIFQQNRLSLTKDPLKLLVSWVRLSCCGVIPIMIL
ncbi:hypothetical protein PR048_001941, partial [Dryococelus australis]